MFDAIIVGSGVSGVSAAYGLRGKKVLMLDIGKLPPPKILPPEHLFNLKQRDDNSVFDALLGKDFQSLRTVDGQYRSPKLKGPGMDYILENILNAAVDNLTPAFDPHISFAKGGLANAWGAGVLRYTSKELERFPISNVELDPYYDELTKVIGISGTQDALTTYFGSTENLLPPMPLGPLAQAFYNSYQKKEKKLNRKGLFVGRPRAAILTTPYQGRPAYQAHNHDFFESPNDAIYHPSVTLDQLINAGQLEYLANYQVLNFVENESGVTVTATNTRNNQTESFVSRTLFLAAGALNSAKIVLQSANDFKTKLPLLDNPVSFIPFINPCLIGTKTPQNNFAGGELILIDDSGDRQIQGAIYGLTGPLMTDLIAEMPLSIRDNITALRYLLPAMGMLQLFYPDAGSNENFISLQQDGNLNYSYNAPIRGNIEKRLIRVLQSFYYLSLSGWCKYPPPGSSIHYAGTLGMSETPGPYQSSPNGQLYGTQGVYVVDGGALPYLPAKNHSFTMMANSLRIATEAGALL